MVRTRRPGLTAGLTRGRERIRPPEDLTTLGVQGSDTATDAKLATGDANIDRPIVVDRRAGNSVAILPLLDGGLPHHLASLGIQGYDIGVELAEKHHPLTQRHATVYPAAADGTDLLIDARPVLPEELTGLGIHRKGVVVARDHVHDAILDERRGLVRVLAAVRGSFESDHPGALEVLDVGGIDLLQRRIALIGQVTAIRHPVLAYRAP